MITLDQVNEGLADRLEELLPDLIGGTQTRAEWVAASTKQGGPGDSLIVVLRGTRRGQWYHHTAGCGGDPLGLVNYVRFANNDMKGAFRWARDWLGQGLKPESQAEREQRAKLRAIAQRRDQAQQRNRMWQERRHVRRIFFQEGELDWRDTPAWRYLDTRLCGHLAELGPIPAIRYVPGLFNKQLERRLPAMVAAIVNLKGEVDALHRTWLIDRGKFWDRLRPTDAPSTADGKPLKGKKVLGSILGGSIHLWPGEHRRSDGSVRHGLAWSKLKLGESITLAEGIETGLTLALVDRRRRVASVVSIAGFGSVILPAAFEQVVIAADRDPGNAAAASAIERARARFGAEGRGGKVIYPPPGFDDWNSMLQRVCEAHHA
jgi:hypothetical protein